MASEIRAICPECDSITLKGRVDGKFYINSDTGLGYCHHCGFKGKFEGEAMDNLNVVSIKERLAFDPKSFEALSPLSDVALRYLAGRYPGVREEEFETFNLRYSAEKHAIAIPTYNPKTKALQGIKYRFITEMGGMRYIAEEASQFGGYWLSGKDPEKLLIVEGEFDAIAAKLCNFNGSVLALQTNKLSSESLSLLKTFKHVFLALDNDEAGQDGTNLIKQTLWPLETTQLTLSDAKDINELYVSQGAANASKWLLSETRTELERSTVNLSDSTAEMINFLSDRRNTRGDTTGWKSIDHILGGGLRPNEMTVINAFAKAGKTSFIINIIHNLASINKKVGLASFEMIPATQTYPTLLSIAGQINLRAITDKKTLVESVELLSNECSYLSNIITLKKFGYTKWAEVEEWAIMMKKSHSIEYLILDHSGFMTEKMTDADQNQELAKNIKKLSISLGLHIIVVVQAPKSKDGLSIQTSYGGMAWGQNADNFIILERSKTEESELHVRLEAARYPGAHPSHTPVILFYDRETCSLLE